MTNTIKFSQFTVANLNDSSTQIVGLATGVNIRTPKVVVWTTATRPSPPYNGVLGLNNDLSQYEFWDASSLSWIQLASSVDLTATFITKLPELTLPNSFALSTLSTGILKNTTGTGVPTISAPLTSIDSLVTSANEIIYTTGINTYAVTALSTFSRGLLADPDAATWRSGLGVAGLPVNVNEGGTGDTSFTPFALIAGGTTSTNPLQNVASLGTSGQVLTSNGAGSLPTWQNSSSSGIVNPGLINEVAYYAANGSAVSGLATANNGVLVTDNSGVPSISSMLPGAVQLNITELGTITVGTWNGNQVTVPFGGTGDTSFTAYAVICGGTTSTGALQNVSGVGAVGQVLTSQGAGNLPAWVNAPGTGTINSGLTNQLAYYASAGTTLSGLSTANSGILVTSNVGAPSILAGPGTTGNILQSNAASAPSFSTATYPSTTTINQILYSSAANIVSGLATANSSVLVTGITGAPSLSTTLPSGLTIPGYAKSGANSDITSMTGLTGVLQAPTFVNDSNGNHVLGFNSIASAVNYLAAANSITGVGPAIVATGSDSAIYIGLNTKNSYVRIIDTTATIAPALRLYNAATTHYTGLQVATAQSTDVTFTLPAADGAANAVLSTNGSAVLSFQSLTTLSKVPQITVLTAGTGTYTTPSGALYLIVEGVGAGAGGSGSGTSTGGSSGTAGNNTTFGTSFLTANGGGAPTTFTPGAGGSASGGDVNIPGGAGSPGTDGVTANAMQPCGGNGGNSYFGGSGAGGAIGTAAGQVAATNSGAGGGGGGMSTAAASVTGAGGGAGGYFRKLITSPLSSYAYVVGGQGGGGAAGVSGANGGNGAAGIIIVTAYFQ